jgi:cyclic-di-AMP phosphodiesterase PgpH
MKFPRLYRADGDAPSAVMDRLNTSPAVRIALGVGAVAVLMLLFAQGLTKDYEYAEGTIWNDDDLIAPFAFPVYRAAGDVEEEQAEAVRATAASFDRLPAASRAVRDSLRRRLAMLVPALDQVLGGHRDGKTPPWRADSLTRAHRTDPFTAALHPAHWQQLLGERAAELRAGRSRDSLKALAGLCAATADDIYRTGLLDKPRRSLAHTQLALSNGAVEDLLPVASFIDGSDLRDALRHAARARGLDSVRADLVTAFTARLIVPNILYNSTRTQMAIQSAIDRVPRTDGIIKQNERIVSRHERVSPAIKMKLDSYQRALRERSGETASVLQYLGKAGHAAVILLFLVIYLSLFRPRIFGNNSRLFLIALLLLFEAVLARLSFEVALPGPVQYLILVPVASMLITIVFDSRVAFYSTVTAAFLVGALRGNDYSIALASAVAGTLAIYTVRDIKNRTQIFRSLIFVFVGYGAAITVDGLQRALPLSLITSALFYASINAVLSPVITFGALIFIERVFGVSTDLTLLELSDFNHPLLRMLSSRAPGTFHHSVVMGTLAEAAAAAVGANPILARVGAYYHDVGKIVEPETFIENQRGSSTVHDSLSPRQSAARILNHVREGIALAREHRLPSRVIEFIPSHHGTTIVSYFFEKERASAGAETPRGDFQYPGPQPSTKETAIVMLADTIEAAARALDEPTVPDIEALIESIVTRRLQDGQLAQSELTFRDLTHIKQSFLNVLIGIHHSRIQYPTEQEAQAAQRQAERTARLLHLPTTTEALLKRMKDATPE